MLAVARLLLDWKPEAMSQSSHYWYQRQPNMDDNKAREPISRERVEEICHDPTNVDRAYAIVSGLGPKDPPTMMINAFGKKRELDTALFQPRGHYTKNRILSNYFQSMMWLSKLECRLSGREGSELQWFVAKAMWELTQLPSVGKIWQQLDHLLTLCFGAMDNLTVADLNMLHEQSATGLPSDYQTLQTVLAQLPRPSVCSAVQFEGEEFPHVFVLFGQRWSLESVALQQFTQGFLPRERNVPPRRIPSGLDVCYSVFQNDFVWSELEYRMHDEDGVPFRDGIPYAAGLVNMRSIVDDLPDNAYSSTVLTQWIRVLQQLSKTHQDSPSSFRMSAMKQRLAVTQLASWTELRHDSILYVKPSFSCITMCEYPAGYVEPNASFWGELGRLVGTVQGVLESMPEYNHQKFHCRFLSGFAETMEMVHDIACKQNDYKGLSEEQKRFLRRVIEESGGSGATRFNGWYPGLFYRSRRQSGEADPLVVDIHHAPPDREVGHEGCRLYQGTGYVPMMLVAVPVPVGEDKLEATAFMGPVSSYYEFVQPWGAPMLDDKSWREDGMAGKRMPSWATHVIPSPTPVSGANFT